MTREDLARVLLPRSTLASFLSRYSTGSPSFLPVEYENYRSNHMSHGVIALARLGADIPRLERFVHWYSKRLGVVLSEENRKQHCTCASSTNLQEWATQVDTLKGTRTQFNAIRGFYVKLFVDKYNLDFTTFANSELPMLVRGLCSAAFHALIQLGYGLAEAHPSMVPEGLAYMCYSYRPLTTKVEPLKLPVLWGSQFVDVKAIQTVLEATTTDSTLLRCARDKKYRAALREEQHGIGAFQPIFNDLFENYGDLLYECVKSIHIPLSCTNVQQCVEEMCDFFLTVTVHLLASCYRKNDFFLLHAVTGAWSLREVMRCLVGFDAARAQSTSQTALDLPQLVHDAGVVFLCGLVATYISQGAPKFVDDDTWMTCGTTHDWDTLISDVLRKDAEEHVFKLVAICFELYSVLSESPDRSSAIKKAKMNALWRCAENAVSAPLYFHNDQKDLLD